MIHVRQGRSCLKDTSHFHRIRETADIQWIISADLKVQNFSTFSHIFPFVTPGYNVYHGTLSRLDLLCGLEAKQTNLASVNLHCQGKRQLVR